jgi:hypothetical protein
MKSPVNSAELKPNFWLKAKKPPEILLAPTPGKMRYTAPLMPSTAMALPVARRGPHSRNVVCAPVDRMDIRAQKRR